jgi:hypothetical protein
VSNEAAERLRQQFRDSENESWEVIYFDDFPTDLDAALAAERRATVERIAERLYEITTQGKSALYFRAAAEVILDAEAAR